MMEVNNVQTNFGYGCRGGLERRGFGRDGADYGSPRQSPSWHTRGREHEY